MKKLLYILIIMLCLTGCKTRYIEVPKVHTEYQTKYLVQHDTLRTTDSILIRYKGDTVFVGKIRYRDRVSVINRTDTIIKTDSIPIYVPVEKNLSLKQKTYIIVGKYTLAIGGMAILVIIILYVIKHTKIIGLIKTLLGLH